MGIILKGTHSRFSSVYQNVKPKTNNKSKGNSKMKSEISRKFKKSASDLDIRLLKKSKKFILDIATFIINKKM